MSYREIKKVRTRAFKELRYINKIKEYAFDFYNIPEDIRKLINSYRDYTNQTLDNPDLRELNEDILKLLQKIKYKRKRIIDFFISGFILLNLIFSTILLILNIDSSFLIKLLWIIPLELIFLHILNDICLETSLDKKIKSSYSYKNVLTIWLNKANQSINELDFYKNLSWQEFEKTVALRLQNMGFDAEQTNLSGDNGVDVILITPKGKRVLIQCKKYSKKIGTPYVRNLVGAMKDLRSSLGIIITTGPGYSEPAEKLAKRNNIILFDLVDFLSIKKEELEYRLK